MKAFFDIRPKYKIALSLLTLVILLLCGVLVERNFFSRVNEASTSIYKDRLIPSTAVYHLSDHITQRRFMLEGFLEDSKNSRNEVRDALTDHQQEMDSIVRAFEETYLVENESKSLTRLKEKLVAYTQIENSILSEKGSKGLQRLHGKYADIRTELMELSQIQTRVGQKLFNKTQNLTSNAGMVSQLQIVALIVICLITQGFILASRAISSNVKQSYNLN